jgi:tetratricopeptide (TPR) repeat protein
VVALAAAARKRGRMSVAPAAAAVDVPKQAWWRSHTAIALTLILLVVLAYGRTFYAGFIWDDDAHLTANPTIIGPLGLREIWTTASANYFPLVLTNLWVQHALWGLSPLPYHFVNVVLHAATAVLLGFVLLRLGIRGAWWGAAFWALHPVQVESVAWISELKNTQSAFFYLAAVLLYLRWLDSESRSMRTRLYAGMLGCSVAAMLSKPSTVMLPVALLLCVIWKARRISWSQLTALAPIAVVSAVASGWTIWEQKYHSLAAGAEWHQSFLTRVSIAGKAIWFYLEKLVWPHPLTFIYPRWSTRTGVADLVPAALVLGALWLLWMMRRRTGPLLFAFVYFIALLFPVLDFFDVYFFRYSFVADHFQYLASMGPLALAGAGVAILHDRLQARFQSPINAAAALLLLCFGVMTVHATRAFTDSATLWRTTLARNSNAWIAATIVGNAANDAGRAAEAIRLHRHAIKLDPAAHEPHYNLGVALEKAGDPREAIVEYQEALRLKPDYADAENNLAVAYATLDRYPEAIPHYVRALQLNPTRPETEFGFGIALAVTGHDADAIPHFKAALKLRPTYLEAHYALARTEESLGNELNAIDEYRATVALDPGFRDARERLAKLQSNAGQPAPAIALPFQP